MDTRESVIMTYEKILSGEQKTFSPYFFQPQHRKERLVLVLQYFIQDKLGFTPEEALTKLTMDMVRDYQLAIILKYVDKPVEYLDDAVQHLVYFAFPQLPLPTSDQMAVMVYQDLLNGKRKTFPKNYFLGGDAGERRAVVCFQYLCEQVLKLNKEDILKTFMGPQGLKTLADYKLKIIMNILFFSMIDLLNTAYPGEFDFSKH